MYNTLHKLKLSHVIGRNFLTTDFLPFKLFYKLIRKINFTKKVKRNGVRFKVLIKDGMGFTNFISQYETWLDNILPKLIEKEEAVFLDVGANTGQTMIKVLPYFPKIKYYAVEPNINCVSYLQSLCEINRFDTVQILNCALSDFTGETELLLRYSDDILATTSHSFRKFTKYSSKMTVPVFIGDNMIPYENIQQIDILKVDVEGGESKVIVGLQKTIQAHQPYIICEILPIISKDDGVTQYRTDSAHLLISTLQNLEYSLYNISSGKLIKNTKDLSDSLESSNYVGVPKEKKSIIDMISI